MLLIQLRKRRSWLTLKPSATGKIILLRLRRWKLLVLTSMLLMHRSVGTTSISTERPDHMSARFLKSIQLLLIEFLLMMKLSAIGKTILRLLHQWSPKDWHCLHLQHHSAGTSISRRVMREMLNATLQLSNSLILKPNATGKTIQPKHQLFWHKDYLLTTKPHHSLTTTKSTPTMSTETWHARLPQLSQTVIVRKAHLLVTSTSVQLLKMVNLSASTLSLTMDWQALIQHAKVYVPTREEFLCMEATTSLISKVINIPQSYQSPALETKSSPMGTTSACCEEKLKIKFQIWKFN